MDLGFVCDVTDIDAVQTSPDEVMDLLFVPPEEIDTARFAFASVGRIVERFKAEGGLPAGP
jgi:hypothetical protein